MILGLLADAHGNAQALAAALDLLSGRCDLLLFAGDAMDQYRFSNEVVEQLREHEVRSILGNHDEVVLGPLGERVRSAAHVRPENLDFLRALPVRLELELGEKRLLLVHGSPWERHRYVYPGDPILERFADLGFDYVVLGHTHIAMAHTSGSTLVVNPGSIGESRGAAVAGTLSFAILDTDDDSISFRQIPNPNLVPGG